MKLIFQCSLLTICLVLSSYAQGIDIENLDPNMTLAKADAKGVAWFDPRARPFRLVGFPWIGEDKV